jgi:hypothetical protein
MKLGPGFVVAAVAIASGCSSAPYTVRLTGDVDGASIVAPEEVRAGIYEVVDSYEDPHVARALEVMRRAERLVDASSQEGMNFAASIASTEKSAASIAETNRSSMVTPADLVRFRDDLAPLPGATVTVTLKAGDATMVRTVPVTARGTFAFVEQGDSERPLEWVSVRIAEPDRLVVERVFVPGKKEPIDLAASLVAILDPPGRPAPRAGR